MYLLTFFLLLKVLLNCGWFLCVIFQDLVSHKPVREKEKYLHIANSIQGGSSVPN